MMLVDTWLGGVGGGGGGGFKVTDDLSQSSSIPKVAMKAKPLDSSGRTSNKARGSQNSHIVYHNGQTSP